MNIAILIVADNKIKLIEASEYGKMKELLKDIRLVCPSCKTKLKYIKKSNQREEFIAESNSYHNLCKKQVSNNFYTPLNKEFFFKLSDEDFNKYLNLLCKEYEKIIKSPIYSIIKSKINGTNGVDFNRRVFKDDNDFIVKVKDMNLFLKNPREKIFLLAEINRCYFNDEFIYLDLLSGDNKISIHLDNKIINTLEKKEINLIKSINSKNKNFIVSIYIDRISLKKRYGINLSVKSKKYINIYEIKE